MLTTLIIKELKAIIQSPKFVGTFAVCAVLMFLSVYVGIREYQASVRQYETAGRLTEQRMQEQSSWHRVNNRAHRAPNPLQIFASGLSYDIGRFSEINAEEGVKLRHSVYSDDPIFAVFRFIDFAFIVQIVLSLFAILFTYDAVCGEREGGTLRLVLANAVPRAHYLFAKCAGAWLGLVVPICLPIILCVLLVVVSGVPMSLLHWAKLITLIGGSLLFFTFFIVAGVFISTLTRRSSVSFLLALVVWMAFVLVIPRAGVLAAGQLVSVPSVAEIEGRRDGFAKAQWSVFYDRMAKRWDVREDGSCPSGEMDDEELWGWMEVEDSLRKEVEREIDAFESKLAADLRRRREAQERLGLSLGRFSPAAAYQLAAMSLAGTGIELKSRYEDALSEYRERFKQFIEKKQEESGHAGGIMISITSEGGFDINQSREGPGLDFGELPRFDAPQTTYAAALAPAVTDLGLLAFYTVVAFAGAFVRFIRYDVR
jgi:ABC-type transport system involved in multi-copper enzyme maturation permease subunit